jgi:trimeric autotransporter adhesin
LAITTTGDAALLDIDVGFTDINQNLGPGLAGRILDSRATPVQTQFLAADTPDTFSAMSSGTITIEVNGGPATIDEAWSYTAAGIDFDLPTYSLTSLDFTGPSGQSINYVGTIDASGGSYTSINYTILHDNASVTTTVSYTGNMERGVNGIVIGGTINSISITDGTYIVQISGTLTLDSQGEIASGTVTAYTFSDGTNSISATDVSVPWSTFDAASFNDLQAGSTFPNGGQGVLFASLTAADDTFAADGVANTMVGGEGNDTYNVDNVGDVVTELLNEGTDTVITGLNYILAANVENLTLTAAGLTATGNGLDNLITVQAGNNTVDGDAGTDIYVLGVAKSDVTNITESGGTYTITRTTGTDVLTNIETLRFTDGDLSPTALKAEFDAAVLAGNNTFGAAGPNTMVGGAGDDTYNVDDVGDVVTELLNEGDDTVITALDNYTLADNVENLTLTGTANLVATGNALANTITGNSGNNTIDGGAGADNMAGGLGDDTYTVDNAGDVVNEDADEGTDTVITALNNYTLAANVENLTLTGSANLDATGNALNNVITGNTGNNAIDGGDGNDTFVFGVAQSDVTAITLANGAYTITRSAGTDDLTSIETLRFTDGDITPEALLALLTPEPEPTGPTITVNGVTQTAEAYSDPNVPGLAYRFVGTNNDQTTQPDVVTGTAFGDLINLLAGDDAADGGDGDDVLDGGTGSNFLTGGNGSDTFFVDGRGNTGTTWSTITDFTTGDQATLWGWVDGTSQLIETVENGGATGFTGATFHYDLDNDGLIETSITFTGLAVADVPTPTSGIVETNPFLFFVA